MNTKLIRFISVFLALALIFSLAGCGNQTENNTVDKNTENSEIENEPEYVYTSEVKPLISGVESFNVLSIDENGIYFSVQECIGQRELYEGEVLEYEGQLNIYTNRLKRIDYNGNVTDLYNYVPSEVDLSEYENNSLMQGSWNYISALQVCGDELLVVENASGYCYEDIPGVELYSDEFYEKAYHGKDEYIIKRLDKTGAEISAATIDVSGFKGEYFGIYNALFLENGNLLACCDQYVMLINSEGQIISDYELDGWADDIVTLNDGRVCIPAYINGYGFYEVNTETCEVASESICTVSAYNLVNGYGGDYDFYYINGTNFFGYSVEEQKSEKLFNLLNCDINGENTYGMQLLDDGTVIVVLYKYNNKTGTYDVSIADISKKPYSEVPQKETITLACQYIDSEFVDRIIEFNRSHDDVRIEVKDYSEYNTEDDYTLGLTKLTTEILSGQMPDILCLSGLPVAQLISKGLLENLYPYIDADNELSRDDIVPGVLSAMEVNGGIYYATPSFYINTIVGASSIVGDTPGWTYDELYEALAKMPEGCTVFDQYTTRSSILYSCLYQCINQYIDWDKGEVHFNSPDFIELLKFANSFPDEFDWDNYDYSDESSTEGRIMQGMQMLMEAYISDVFDTVYYGMYFGGSDNVTFIGYPTADGNSYGSTIVLENGVGISAKSPYKEQAWEFVRTMFTEDYQENAYGLHTNQNCFNNQLSKAMQIEYKKNAAGEYMLDDNGEKIPVAVVSYYFSDDNIYKIFNLSEEEASRLVDLINNTDSLAGNDVELYNIVVQEAEAYFSGQKTAEDVANLIQSKLTIYINEKR